MSGYTSVVDAAPAFVPGTFDGQDVRIATIGNMRPGIMEAGDFAVSQRAAGANMSVDIAAGRAFVTPGDVARQGTYAPWMGSTYNTSSNGGYTWTAADAANPRIDIVGIDLRDTDFSGSYTGFKFRVIDGTAAAGATHQLNVTNWPAIPTGVVPLAAVRVPALATTLTTANITNLNAIGGFRPSYQSVNSTAETTTSTTYARLATPDFVCVYVPHAGARVRVSFHGLIKISVASGTQGVAMFVNDQQLKRGSVGGVPVVVENTGTSAATFYNIIASSPAPTGPLQWTNGAASDSTIVATGQLMNAETTTSTGSVDIFGLPAGWYVPEVKYKTSANTLTIDERRMWAEVVG